MPTKDIFHKAVIQALIKEGWTITHDPLHLKVGKRDLYIDLGGERPIAAEKGGLKIAVEIKSFLGPSDVHDLELATGQYIWYREILAAQEPQRHLYLAVTDQTYSTIFSDQLGQLLINGQKLRLLVFDDREERIVAWIP